MSASKTLRFGYPRRGLNGSFNTFRPGRAWEKTEQGTAVDLVDSRSGKLLLRASVTAVHVGTLVEMASLHARDAHNWQDHAEELRPALLKASLTRRYPPGRITPDSIVSVIYLKEIPDEHVPGADLGV